MDSRLIASSTGSEAGMTEMCGLDPGWASGLGPETAESEGVG